MKKTEKREDIKKEDVSDQEYEDDDEEARGGGRMLTHETRYERDHQGKYIICEVCIYLLSSLIFIDLYFRCSIFCVIQNIKEGEENLPKDRL